MYRSSTDSIRKVAMFILTAQAGMNKQKAIKTLMDLDSKELMNLSKAVKEQGGAGQAVLAMEKEAAVPAALKAALLALAILMPAANAAEQSSVAQAIAKAKEQVQEAKRDRNMATGVVSIGGKKYVGTTKGQIDALAMIGKLDNKLKSENMESTARQDIIDGLIESTGAREAK